MMVKGSWSVYGVLALALALFAVGNAEATGTWTVDLSSVTGDITTIGLAILGLVALIFGFRVVRRMLGR